MVSFYTDPDPEFEKICYGSGFRPNFDTDLDTNPDKTIWIRAKQDSVPGRYSNFDFIKKKLFPPLMILKNMFLFALNRNTIF